MGTAATGMIFCSVFAVLRSATCMISREGMPPGVETAGKEAVGGIRFAQITLKPEETAEYVILMGIAGQEEETGEMIARYASSVKAEQALKEVKEYWQKKVNVRYRLSETARPHDPSRHG